MNINKSKLLLIGGVVVVAGIALYVYLSGPSAPEQTSGTPVVPIEKDVARVDEAVQDEINKQSQSSLLKFVTPKNGTSLCQSRAYLIKWTAPKDMESLTLFLVVPGVEVKLATIPAAAGMFTWYAELSEFPIPVGSGYQLKLGGSYKGEYITTLTDGTFSVKDCGTEGIDQRG